MVLYLCSVGCPCEHIAAAEPVCKTRKARPSKLRIKNEAEGKEMWSHNWEKLSIEIVHKEDTMRTRIFTFREKQSSSVYMILTLLFYGSPLNIPIHFSAFYTIQMNICTRWFTSAPAAEVPSTSVRPYPSHC